MTPVLMYLAVAALTAALLRLLIFPDVGRPTTYHTTLLVDELDSDGLADVIRRHDVAADEAVLAVVVRETRGQEEHLLLTDRRLLVTWQDTDTTFDLKEIAGWSKPEHPRLVGEYRLKRRSDPAHRWFTFEVAGRENRLKLESALIPQLARHNRGR